MKYRKMGKTGAEISALGFGAMRLPHINVNENSVIDDENAIAIMRRAYELGVNYFDTAPYYCNGDSERVVGLALKDIRDKVYISTKNPIESASGADWRGRLENSLKKLGTDYIDFYHMWGTNWNAYENSIDVPNGPLEAAYRAKEEGLIRHMSISVHDSPENIIKIIDTGHFESLLIQYNLLDRANEPVITRAAELEMGVVIMGPVAGGRLGGYSQKIMDMLKGKVKSSAETALRFVLANQGVTCALSGMSTMEMVEENARVCSRDSALTEEEMQNVEAALEENRRLSELYCTGCNYCMPCPCDVNIPHIFRLMNLHKVYGLTDYAKDEYSRQETAGNCIECGACEDKCPQSIEIRKQLKETRLALLG